MRLEFGNKTEVIYQKKMVHTVVNKLCGSSFFVAFLLFVMYTYLERIMFFFLM